MFQADDFTVENRSFKSQSNDRLIQLSCEVIESMYEKYENDLYMTSKIHHYISQQLPILLENIQESRTKSIQRNQDHSAEQDRFTQIFLSSNKYYYHSPNEFYFFYDGISYKNVTEDEILHHIVSSISEDRNPMLMNWKHRTKISILKKIKERNFLNAIPESNTIQTVLEHLRSLLCNSKSEAKLFLTILGDNILKKNPNRIHYVNPMIRYYLKYINNISMMQLNVQCTQTFKFKYHEKHLENLEECRLIPSVNTVPKNSWYEPFLQKKGLDILCVAVHYSYKYTNADELLETLTDEQLRNNFHCLKIKTPHNVLNDFRNEYLLGNHTNDVTTISCSPQEEYFLQASVNIEESSKGLLWTEMQYLWKDFLKHHQYPSNLYQNIYKKILVEDFFHEQYHHETETFQNVSSSQIPFIKKFLKFWDETIIDDDRNFAELELEEISNLFRKWLNLSKTKNSKYSLTEWKILDVLFYFHPELAIGDNKYVYNVRSLMWDKDCDIDNAIDAYNEQNKLDNTSSVSSLDDAYTFYCKFHTVESSNNEKLQNNFFVSKSYFTKYLGNRESIKEPSIP